MDYTTKLQKLQQEAAAAIQSATDSGQLEQVNTKYLGRKSELTDILRSLKDVDEKERGQVGSKANKVRTELAEKLDAKLTKLKQTELSAKLIGDKLDLGLPAIPSPAAKVHPITTEREIIEDIFQRMGFTVHEPYLVDDEYHNFTSLNIPEGHPARDMWDTVHVDDNLVMITHTSSMQNRLISRVKETGEAVRAIVPGKCFRNEATDATHEHSFFQIEGVYVDKGIKLSDMIGTLSEFLNQYFGREVPLKIQPTFFPFVEPGLEIMMPRPGT
ncbi:phenylalanine--tRNA ligase subunit alpha, partial [Candidatus Dojkabacteria bacterium]|nr:phenylalanine--tRNA ligase subunit alpha [Candidatus Dojkabacteria bacterium]